MKKFSFLNFNPGDGDETAPETTTETTTPVVEPGEERT